MLRDPNLLVLLLAGSLTTMAGGVVAPILPEMVQQLHLDPGLAGNLVSMHCLTIALFSPLLGILADRLGRLIVLVPSLVLYALFGMAGAFMDSLGPLLVTRGLLGAASGGIAAASLGLLGSMYYDSQERAQALGYATSTLTITGIAFPLLGGLVGASNWRFAFLLYGLGLPLALIASLILKQQPKQARATPKLSGRQLIQVLGHPQTWQLLLPIGLTSVAMFTVVIYAPLYLKQTIGAGALVNGVVLASRALGATVVSAVGSKRLAQSLGSKAAITIGLALMAVTLVTIPFLDQLHWILFTAILFGVGFGIVLPNLYNSLANRAPKEVGSSVLAVGTGASFLGQFLSPVLLGPVLVFGGLKSVFYAAAGVTVAGLLLLPNLEKE